ncbi:hypothetical protein R6Q59_022705 [Mikania micrantha]
MLDVSGWMTRNLPMRSRLQTRVECRESVVAPLWRAEFRRLLLPQVMKIWERSEKLSGDDEIQYLGVG